MHVHKDVICASSAFFTSALHGPWIESTSSTIKLPEINEDAFTLYVDWLYGENQDFSPSHSIVRHIAEHPWPHIAGESVDLTPPLQQKSLLSKPESNRRFEVALRAYIVADYLQDSTFCDFMVTEFGLTMLWCRRIPSRQLLSEAWQSLSNHRGLGRLILDVMAVHLTRRSLGTGPNLPLGLVDELMQLWLEIEEVGDDFVSWDREYEDYYQCDGNSAVEKWWKQVLSSEYTLKESDEVVHRSRPEDDVNAADVWPGRRM